MDYAPLNSLLPAIKDGTADQLLLLSSDLAPPLYEGYTYSPRVIDRHHRFAKKTVCNHCVSQGSLAVSNGWPVILCDRCMDRLEASHLSEENWWRV